MVERAGAASRPRRRAGDGGAARPRIADFAGLLAAGTHAATAQRLERAAMVGRPLGALAWIAALEARLGRRLAPRKPGPKPRAAGAAAARLPGVE